MSNTSTSNQSISIVVCYHTGDLIDGFLQSVTESTIQAEVIVVSSDANFNRDGVTVLHSTEGPAAKRNLGARFAKGDYIAFFDDDVTIDTNCLYWLKYALEEESCGMVYGKLWNMEHRNRFDEAGGFLTFSGFMWSRAEQNEIDRGQYDREEPILAGKSASCMIKREVFEKIGGFDEEFGILGEETDLSWRVWLSGQQVLFVPSATGYHAFNTKFKPPEKFYKPERVFYNGPRNYVTMLIKNLGLFNLILILPIHVSIWAFVGLAKIFSGKLNEGILIWKGILYNLRPSVWIKRWKVQRTRKIADRNLFKYIYRNPKLSYFTQRFLRYLKISLHG